jgi:hypothetical protein
MISKGRARGVARVWLVAAWCAMAAFVTAAAPASAQERFGAVSGVVKDDSGAVLPGVTVTINNKGTGKTYTVVSGNDGAYRILDLEPGRYSVKFELQGFSPAEVADVNLLLGKTIQVDGALKVGGLTEAVSVKAEAPLIDTRGTTIAHNITAEEFDQMPKTRTFQGLALTSPSVNSGQIEGGFQVNGSSGAENSFTIDGVVTNSLVDGRSRQDAVYEYLQEVQVKTGGIGAEYGGALGGVISAVTKSGGNTFRGEGHYYYTGDRTSADPVKRLVLNPDDLVSVTYFQDQKQTFATHDVGGSIGGPIIKDKLFFFGSVAPRFIRNTNDYNFSSGTEHGSIDQKLDVGSYFGKVNYDATNRLHTAFSVLRTPTTQKGTLPAYNGYAPNTISSSLASNQANLTRGFEQPQTSYAGTVDFTLTPSSLLSVRAGLFDDNYKDTGIPLISSVSYDNSNLDVPFAVPDAIRGGAGFQNTPRTTVSAFDETKRGYINADYVQNLTFAGSHSFKGGFGWQRASNNVDQTYPGGGYVFIHWDTAFRSNATGITDRGQYGYYEVNDIGTRGKASSNLYSLYVQDQWQMNRLTLNLGIRTENETIPSFRTDLAPYAIKFGWGDKLAPRLGASYDVRGDGKLKVYGSWGRYFDWTKYELARGSFGGDIWKVHYRSLDTLDVFSISGTNMPGRNLWSPVDGSFRDRRVPNFNSVDPNLKPMSMDATNLGMEFQVAPSMVFTANYVHNNLRRTIEDMGVLVDGNEVYKYVNPGEGIATDMLSSGLTPDFATPKPKRQYDAMELTLTKRFSSGWFGSASYVYSRLYGNYAGLANTDEISTPTTGVSSATTQQQGGSIARPGSSATRNWDLDEVVWDSHGTLNVLGRLATDRPHVMKLYGAYNFHFGTQVGAFFYAGSGTPVSRQVQTDNGIGALVDGRGSMGRTPTLTQTDLLVSHELRLYKQQRLRFEANILNLFNQQTVRHIFDSLNRVNRDESGISLANTDLRNGYDYMALLAQTTDGVPFGIDPRYQMGDLFNPGTSARLSVRWSF